ncbi:alpha beta hydrolase [Colletotrichum truncatum]|uniref:Alpha beta hydrolase n=1 Tax=Colletotrichum truncatum TaxID=5467 RepID=A0ACC3YZY4_COLTU|nr:alpha beta hydrolase [Colletotrichum truncatum]KAF6800828.1 alpha beta hydrolase [Colletotrichum truncatum]
MAGLRNSLNFNEQPFKATMHHFFSSPFYNFELTRILGTAAAGGCDVAEFLEAVGEIKKHDPESWYRAWWKQANRASHAATNASRQGLTPLAKAAYLRAANYYRAAPYMLPTHDRRIVKCGELSAEHFEKATEFMEGKVLSMNFQFGNIIIPARLFLPPESKRLRNGQKTPLLINCGGADSTMEELYFVYGTLGPELGYAVLNFDGPGQGLTLKRSGEPMRPDYEKVLSCVLDGIWVLAKERPDANLDLDRVCVAGISMGGYIALRTAAAEPMRVAACISADPLYDMWELAMTRLPRWYVRMWLSGWISDDFFDWSCNSHMSMDFPTKWEFTTTMHVMGKRRPADVVREFKRYSLRWRPEDEILKGGDQDEDEENRASTILSQIRCPVLVTGASKAIYQTPDASTQRIMDELAGVPEGKKQVWIPENVGEGALTGKVGAWNSLATETFAFLDKQLGISRPCR